MFIMNGTTTLRAFHNRNHRLIGLAELLAPPLVALKWCTSKTYDLEPIRWYPLPSGTVIMENGLVPPYSRGRQSDHNAI